MDLPEGEPSCDGLSVSLQHGLEEAAVGEIALNLAPMALHRYVRQAGRGGGMANAMPMTSFEVYRRFSSFLIYRCRFSVLLPAIRLTAEL